MKKPIFKSEKEFMDFIMDVSIGGKIIYENGYNTVNAEIPISILKEKGYIEQTKLQTARQVYYNHDVHKLVPFSALIYIEELEKELERRNQ